MNHFSYRDGVLAPKTCRWTTLAREVGTPFYCYSSATLARHYKVFAAALPQDSLIAFSVKANGNLAVLKTLARLGAGADVVSGGELKKARAAGIPAEQDRFFRRRQDPGGNAAGAGAKASISSMSKASRNWWP